METLVCKKCGAIDDPVQIPHHVHYAGAWCKNCRGFIKWMPRPVSEEPVDISIDDMIKCAQRELGFRRGFYPKMVAQGRMKQSDADTEIARMDAILRTLIKSKREQDHAHSLFPERTDNQQANPTPDAKVDRGIRAGQPVS